MSDFNALKFVADNAGLNIFSALEKAYEQGKADAKVEAIPVDWLMQKADWCDKNNGIFVSGAIRSAVDAWREEQNNGQTG